MKNSISRPYFKFEGGSVLITHGKRFIDESVIEKMKTDIVSLKGRVNKIEVGSEVRL